ncbi:hypothetical protein F4777DRAFT_576609 [Nemania sp. FL0916]|nr:hypothetical protein F4777DRAFT_576609 [Nemania sp. FL0916]
MDTDAIEGNTERQDIPVHFQDGNTPPEKPVVQHQHPAGTLLPGFLATGVSFATRSTAFTLRMGTAVCGHGLSAAKVTTLSTLELGRGMLSGILTLAGRDVFVGSYSGIGRANAESMLETSLESMHHTMSWLVFWTAAGFHTVGATVSTASQVSQLFLSVLDQFFGSTDSSRAIASIITLVRREFHNPATGVEGEKVNIIDLVLGLCGLAYLQNRCRKRLQEQSRRLGSEEIIWDVIVLNDGERVDAHHDGIRSGNGARPVGSNDMNEPAGAIERQSLRRNSATDGDGTLEVQLRKQIAKSLPDDAKISISTSTTTIKMIAVDILGAPGISIPSFPSLGLVQSEVSNPSQSPHGGQPPSYRVVYKVSRNTIHKMPDDSQDEKESRSSAEELHNGKQEPPNSPFSPISPTASSFRELNTPPRTTPKITRPKTASTVKECSRFKRRTGSASEDSSESGNVSPKELSYSVASRNERAANQKRTRAPLGHPPTTTNDSTLRTTPGGGGIPSKRTNKKPDGNLVKRREKKTGIRGVLGKGPVPTFTNFLSRESSSDNLPGIKIKPLPKPPRRSHKSPPIKSPNILPRTPPIPDKSSSVVSNRDDPQAPQRGNPNYFSSRDVGSLGKSREYKEVPRPLPLPPRDNRRGSLVSSTDTVSIQSYGSQTPSPPRESTITAPSNPLKQKQTQAANLSPPSPQQNRRPAIPRAQSVYTPSIYTLATHGSELSLVVSSLQPRSAYGDSMALDLLRKSGEVKGMFPGSHFLRNITRYSRYASAVYGYNFLKLMGISTERPTQNIADEIHYDVRSFAHHAKLPPDSVLLASFVDPQGGSDSTGSTDTGVPLVHTVTLDEESKAVVLTCRGTLGFEDVLADMMCEYDDLVWQDKTYKVHKGIHASARRLLYGGDGRVLATIKAALEEYPDYGLVLCGHSLGGAVTALLGVMLAEPSANGTGFLTSAAEHPKLLSDAISSGAPRHICLPSDRPIHVYAYGPPATMSPSLQKATRGLITSVVYGNDMVPYLSLGVLHDFQALALAFKTDNIAAKAEVKRRVWATLRSGLADKWYDNNPPNRAATSEDDDDHWGYVALKTLRASMMSDKLLPPGEVFKVETTPVMRRDAFTQEMIDDVGRPATRIVLKYIRDVDAHFREVCFGSGMLSDHSPGRYEDALRRLTLGVVDM